MSVYNYIRAKAEYWELWRGDGSSAETCKKLSETINRARQLGLAEYKKELIKSGLFRQPEDDTYAKKVKEKRE